MALDFLKRIGKKKLQETPAKAPEVTPVAKAKVASLATRQRGGKTGGATSLPSVLLNPHITEKATLQNEGGSYVFRINSKATKCAVKQSVESLYGVRVKSVRLIKKPARKVRLGKRAGMKPGLKKAMVQLQKGESIEMISR
ncbi:MAG: 50S ribosomal protein L23 [bacterium]|nr:50S ribosomal protein L23 [bacterium]